MPKQSLNKSIGAKKLNRRTMTQLPEPEVTIPFGAILDNVKIGRDTVTFDYLSDPYESPRDVFLSAASGSAAKEAKAAARTEPEPAKLRFEGLSSNVDGLSRAKVPGGWLLSTEQGGITFYPDARHEWNGESVE